MNLFDEEHYIDSFIKNIEHVERNFPRPIALHCALHNTAHNKTPKVTSLFVRAAAQHKPPSTGGHMGIVR